MTTSSKIALVTGATRGIGLETVRQLAETGVHTLLAGRDRAKADERARALQAEGLDVEAIALDVTDADSIAAAAEVTRTHGRLDILVNNAGIVVEDFALPPSQQPIDAWRRTFDTNLFGVIAVTQAFLPLLRQSPQGRIVNVSSLLGSLAAHNDPASTIYDFKSIPAYNASKSAVNAWTVHLAYEFRGTPLKVNAVHPGYVKTDMNAGEGEIDVPTGAKSSVGMALLADDGPTGTFTYLGKTLPW